MPQVIPLRAMTNAEKRAIGKLSRSRTAEQRLVQRAQIIQWRSDGQRPADIARRLDCQSDTVTFWIKRFNAEGLAGLRDKAGRGRKQTYSEEQRGVMIECATTNPSQLGQPYSYWSIRRLATYLGEERAIKISPAQLARILQAEGLKWYQEQTYFSERPDPQFVEKRGRS